MIIRCIRCINFTDRAVLLFCCRFCFRHSDLWLHDNSPFFSLWFFLYDARSLAHIWSIRIDIVHWFHRRHNCLHFNFFDAICLLCYCSLFFLVLFFLKISFVHRCLHCFATFSQDFNSNCVEQLTKSIIINTFYSVHIFIFHVELFRCYFS